MEYFVNTSESWSRSHSVGFDLSAVGSLGMSDLPSFRDLFGVDNLRQLGTTLSAPPTVRAEHIESIHQTYSDAGIKTSKGFNVSGRTTELKPDLKNEHKIKVFDSSIINSIGENLTAVGQLRDACQSIGNGAYSEPKFEENDAEFEEKIKAKNQKKRLEIIDKLLNQGATKADIVEIFNNLNIDEQIDASTRMSYRYGGMAIQLLDSQTNADYQQAETNSFLRDSLELFSDTAVELSDFAEKFPHLVDYSLTTMQLAFGGPTRLLFDKFKEATGIQTQIDSCKEVVYDWIGDKVSEISGLDKATSDLLVSSGRFGIGFGFMACGLQSKNSILKDAKKVAKVHKNSLAYRGETHVYHIVNVSKGVEHKIGESARGVNKFGLSKRAESQARKLERETGDRFKTEILETLPGKKEARELETKLIKGRRTANPDALPGNKGVH